MRGTSPQTRQRPSLRRAQMWLAGVLVAGLAVTLVLGNVLAFRLVPSAATHPAVALASLAGENAAAAKQVAAGAPPTSTTPDCHCTPSRTGSLDINASSDCVLPPAYATGQLILVCISREWLYAYQDGKVVFNTGVWTGMPALPTPQGTFHIFFKGTNLVFTSPYPKDSPYWYYPTHINYAMEFDQPGYYLHDAWWHESFGPGADFLHQNPDGTWENGSYGCVGMTVAASKWLYYWSNIGTPVIITY